MGNLGQAIIDYPGFVPGGFSIVAAFDSDPDLVGKSVGGIPVRTMSELDGAVEASEITIGIVAVPASQAQSVIDRLVDAGVQGILNYAPVAPHVPDRVILRNIDPVLSLQSMTYYLLQGSPARLAAQARADPRQIGSNAGCRRGPVRCCRAAGIGQRPRPALRQGSRRGPTGCRWARFPDTPVVGNIHLTVTVEESATDEYVLDANVAVIGEGPGDDPIEMGPLVADRNLREPTYYEINTSVDEVGPWAFTVLVDAAPGAAETTFTFEVVKASPLGG